MLWETWGALGGGLEEGCPLKGISRMPAEGVRGQMGPGGGGGRKCLTSAGQGGLEGSRRAGNGLGGGQAARKDVRWRRGTALEVGGGRLAAHVYPSIGEMHQRCGPGQSRLFAKQMSHY